MGKRKRELTWAEQDRYKERTMVERVNGRLKDAFGGRNVRVRGAAKVMAHLMFGVLALTADQLRKLIKVSSLSRPPSLTPSLGFLGRETEETFISDRNNIKIIGVF